MLSDHIRASQTDNHLHIPQKYSMVLCTDTIKKVSYLVRNIIICLSNKDFTASITFL